MYLYFLTFCIYYIEVPLGRNTVGLFHLDPVSGLLTTASASFDSDSATQGTEFNIYLHFLTFVYITLKVLLEEVQLAYSILIQYLDC